MKNIITGMKKFNNKLLFLKNDQLIKEPKLIKNSMTHLKAGMGKFPHN